METNLNRSYEPETGNQASAVDARPTMNESGLADEGLRKLGDHLLGTCKSVESALESMDIVLPFGKELCDVESDLQGINIERCPGCEWWMESGELVNEEGDVVGCEDCRKDGRVEKENDKDD